MSALRASLEADLDDANLCVKELALLLKILDLLDERLSACGCEASDRECDRWMVQRVRSDLDCQLDILKGALMGFEKFLGTNEGNGDKPGICKSSSDLNLVR